MRESETQQFIRDIEKFGSNLREQELLWKWVNRYESIAHERTERFRIMLEAQAGRKLNDKDIEEAVKLVDKHSAVEQSHRSLEEIIGEFDLSPYQFSEFFSGKKVLDVGAGNSTLASQIEGKKVNAQVVSIDIDPEALKGGAGDRVRANAEFLPFRSGEFDTVLCTWSLPYWANSPKQVNRSFREIKRVAKVGGYILISPIVVNDFRVATRKSLTLVQHGKIKIEGDVRINYILGLNQTRFLELLRSAIDTGELKAVIKMDTEVMAPKSVILKKLK